MILVLSTFPNGWSLILLHILIHSIMMHTKTLVLCWGYVCLTLASLCSADKLHEWVSNEGSKGLSIMWLIPHPWYGKPGTLGWPKQFGMRKALGILAFWVFHAPPYPDHHVQVLSGSTGYSVEVSCKWLTANCDDFFCTALESTQSELFELKNRFDIEAAAKYVAHVIVHV